MEWEACPAVIRPMSGRDRCKLWRRHGSSNVGPERSGRYSPQPRLKIRGNSTPRGGSWLRARRVLRPSGGSCYAYRASRRSGWLNGQRPESRRTCRLLERQFVPCRPAPEREAFLAATSAFWNLVVRWRANSFCSNTGALPRHGSCRCTTMARLYRAPKSSLKLHNHLHIPDETTPLPRSYRPQSNSLIPTVWRPDQPSSTWPPTRTMS